MKKAYDAAAKTTTYPIMFPVILYDGKRQTNVGNMTIRQGLAINEFKTTLSQLIGIHYDDLTTYLVENRKSTPSTEPWKILITDKVNFDVMVRLRNCYFFVVLNRPRTECRMIPGNQSDLLLMHLNLLDSNTNNAQTSAYSYGPSPYCYNYSDGFSDLVMHRENYLNMVLNSGYGFVSPSNVNLPKIEEAESSSNRPLCEDCTTAQKQGKTAEFHLCVYDEVIHGSFRSPAGHISRRR
ncbi:hypothetical protein Lser_V15G02242 [Lactuca serriola]